MAHPVQHVLRKTMGKLMGERTISKQEKCHLIMSIPTIFCSHKIINVNLSNDANRLMLSSSEAAPAPLNFGIIGGLTFDLFTAKIKNHAKVAGRK